MTSSTYKQEAWKLDDLFPGFDTKQLAQALADIETKVASFEKFRQELATEISTARFMEILDAYEELNRVLWRVMGYANLRFAADTQDQTAQSKLAQYRQMAAEANNRTLFFQLWWKLLDDEQSERLMDASGDYRYWLEAVRLERPYTLSEKEERVINIKDVNGPAALITLYSTITDRYVFELEVDGEVKELNREQLSVYVRHSDPEMRSAAYREMFHVYEKDLPVLGQIYQYRVRDWQSENMGLRGFKSPIAVRNLYNDIPDQVVDLLLDVCRGNASLFQRYFQLKAKWLGVEKLRRFDIYAPVVSSERHIDYDDAIDIVLSSFRHFDPEVAALAERVFAEKHIDSEVRKGKRGGAFCATITPDLTPWILQTYNGKPDDVATLAHELGHAVHSMLADHHKALTQHASLPLAETASTFGEMLVIDRLLADDPDPETQRDLLFRQMDANYATIMRQAYFALFEREAHELVRGGAEIDALSEAYLANLADQFGDSLDLNPEFKIEWIVVPHIYNVPFYVYAYAFGQLLVLSLYQQYLEEGQAFKPRYKALLAAGGSDAPARILKNAGIEIEEADFWQGGFDVLANTLAQLEALKIEKLA